MIEENFRGYLPNRQRLNHQNNFAVNSLNLNRTIDKYYVNIEMKLFSFSKYQ